MIRNLQLLAILLAALMLSACATTDDAASVDDGAMTSGADTGATDGQALDSSDLLSERTVYFAFDSSAVDSRSAAIIEAHANHLNSNSDLTVDLGGHCDERGTREYNLALGERRANAIARMLRALGVAGSRITSNSYGEEKPVDSGHDESAWRQNRRVEISY